MNEQDRFDVIVVGGGVAGICCAGELVLQGLRPLLIAETKEVAANVRSEWIEGNRVSVQSALIHPLHQGGWWLPLAKALQVPLAPMNGQAPISISLWPATELNRLHLWYPSAQALMGVFETLSPIPLGELATELEKVLTAALVIPFDDLADLDEMLWHEWLSKHTADGMITYLLDLFVSLLNQYPTLDLMAETTVFGALGPLRLLFCGEAFYPEVFPDLREGVFIPMAQAIEQRGGTIWRGRKVASVATSEGRIGSVTLVDGTDVTAGHVAIATGNDRIPKLLDPVPAEVQQISGRDFGEHTMRGYYNITLLEREVLPTDFHSWHAALSMDPLGYQAMWPSHARLPWGTEPGKQILVSLTVNAIADVEAMGGKEVLYERMRGVEDHYFPQMREAVQAVKTVERAGMWYSQVLASDKLRRRSESVKGLWYVGNGSTPIRGLYTEAAASAGILGAREIAAARGLG